MSLKTQSGLPRRTLAALALAGLLARCSDSGPDQADVLDQVMQHLRTSPENEGQAITDLAFKSGHLEGKDRYIVQVSYVMQTLTPGMGLFNEPTRRGDRAPVEGEQYLFLKTGDHWRLQED